MWFNFFIKQVNRFTFSDFDWNLNPYFTTPKFYRLHACNGGAVNENNLRVTSGHYVFICTF